MREKIAPACPVVDLYGKLLAERDRFEADVLAKVEAVRATGKTIEEALAEVAKSGCVKTASFCQQLLERAVV